MVSAVSVLPTPEGPHSMNTPTGLTGLSSPAREVWMRRAIASSNSTESDIDWFKKINDEGEEGSYSGTVVQALLLMNGQTINEMIADKKDGTAEFVAQKRGAGLKSLPFAIQDMYMHVLGRPATEKEVKDYMSESMINVPRRPGTPPPNTGVPAFWTNYYEDIMWALLNSNAFLFNR